MQTGRLLKSNFNSSIVRNVKIKQNKKSIIKTYSFIYSHKILSCTWSVLYIFFQFDFWLLLSYLLLLVGCLVMFSGLSSSTISVFFFFCLSWAGVLLFFLLIFFFVGFKGADCTKSSVIFCFADMTVAWLLLLVVVVLVVVVYGIKQNCQLVVVKVTVMLIQRCWVFFVEVTSNL